MAVARRDSTAAKLVNLDTTRVQQLLRWRWPIVALTAGALMTWHTLEHYSAGLLQGMHLLQDVFVFAVLGPLFTGLALTWLARANAERIGAYERLSLKDELSRQLADTDSWDELTTLIVSFPRRVLPVIGTSLFVRDAEADRFDGVVEWWDPDRPTPSNLTHHELPCDCQACTSRPSSLSPTASQCHRIDRTEQSTPDNRYCLPLKHAGELIGLLYYYLPEGVQPTDQQIHILNALGPLMAVALDGARAERAIVQQAALVSAERKRIARDLHDTLGQSLGYLHLDRFGPATTSVSLAPNPTDGSVDVILTATIPGATSAEYFIDALGEDGAGTPMSEVGTDEWTATISAADLTALLTGDHTIYVHGSDGTNWGPFNFDVLHLDKLGPATTGVSLAPNPSRGTVAVNVSATGDDRAAGNSNIAAAEYFIGAGGADGAGTPLAVNVDAPIASLDSSIDVATMGGLSEGDHTVYVHSMDAFGWWGDYITATLVVDQTGPTTSDVTAAPNPNNGALPYNPTRYAVRVDATITDGSSTIERVEGFIDTVGADGSGFPLTPRDGLFNELTEDAYAYIPLTTINALEEGAHQIWIHGQDRSGNWGDPTAVDLIIDKTAPTVSDIAADPNPTGEAITTTLTADASDTASNILRAEWFVGTDPGPGNGTPMVASDGTFDSPTEVLTATIDVSAWAPGDHTLSVRARDAAGNWSATETYVLSVGEPDTIFADSFTSGDTSAWSAASGELSVIAGAAMDGDGFGLAADITDGAASYVTDETPDAETSYHARFTFNPNGVESEDVQEITLFDGQDSGSNSIFRVEYQRLNAGDGSYQVRGVVLTTSGEQTTAWVDVDDESINVIEIAWESGPGASFDLYVQGELEETLVGLDTSDYTLDSISLGPSGGPGLNGSALGSLYVDAFVSVRYTVIGP